LRLAVKPLPGTTKGKSAKKPIIPTKNAAIQATRRPNL
jgi:hypothetical protein